MKNRQNSRIFHDSCPKNYQSTRIFMIFVLKNIQNSRILHDLCPKNARILHNNCPKNIFPNFRGARAPLPPSPTSMADNDVSRGSVATHLRCGGIFSDPFIANLLSSIPAPHNILHITSSNRPTGRVSKKVFHYHNIPADFITADFITVFSDVCEKT